jgi:hypothetical protein
MHAVSKQARAGDIVTSARAITADILKKIFDFNEVYRKTHPLEVVGKRGDFSIWGNSNTCCMLQFLYILSFWCLLRYDEALNIDFNQIEMDAWEDGTMYLRISLPFRKTHQYGGE